jgi:hypothetical protein
MRTSRRAIVFALVYVLLAQSFWAPYAAAGDLFQSVFKRKRPQSVEHPTVEQLAREIDWLSQKIDNYGSIVAKHPDVWGQARMTKHRQEYEREMAAQINQFKLYINATISQRDAAYLANALSLGIAVSGTKKGTVFNPQTKQLEALAAPQASTSLETVVATTAEKNDDDGTTPGPGEITVSTALTNPNPEGPHFGPFAHGGVALEPTVALDQMSRYMNHLNELRRINEGDDTADAPGYALNLVRIPVSLLPGTRTRQGYGAEITCTIEPRLSLDLLPTTFRNLVINDVVDQLDLPITRLADAGIWREMDEMSEECKRECKRDCEITVAMWEGYAKEELKDLQCKLDDMRKREECLNEKLKAKELEICEHKQSIASLKSQEKIITARMDRSDSDPNSDSNNMQMQMQTQMQGIMDNITTKMKGLEKSQNDLCKLEQDVKKIQAQLNKSQEETQKKQARIKVLLSGSLFVATGPAGRTRRARNPIPPTQVEEIYGADQLVKISKYFSQGYVGPHVRWQGKSDSTVHLPDVQRYLQAETEAAYELLRDRDDLWCLIQPQEGCSLGLAQAIQQEHKGLILAIRNKFFERLEVSKSKCTAPGEVEVEAIPSGVPAMASYGEADQDGDPKELIADTTVQALAWAILVESALLNEHLLDDMRRVAEEKGCYNCMEGTGMMYEPNPSQEDRIAFNEYVICRWPIVVFALDPVTQDQNVAEQYSRRRELQLAASIALVSGQMNLSNFTKFTRNLDMDLAAVTLNRTAAGFVHNSDTFGWRFMPRVQPPKPKGTLHAIGETLCGGPSTDRDLLDRRIEPGMRECVAVVVMPSFVPYVMVDVHGNWFRLNHRDGWLPTRHDTEPSTVDMVKLSRSIRTMHDMAATICDAPMYRHGEVDRLMRRIHQLDRELPLQTMTVQVPIENTQGGFELFSSGVTDLAPELTGWYGAPGIRVSDPSTAPHCCKREYGDPTRILGTGTVADAAPEPIGGPGDFNCVGTTLFLVGRNFSVHDTKVIAGGKYLPQFTLLSREVMRVTIPADVNTVTFGDGPYTEKYVDVHVATPYGVTSHLHIPAVETKKKETKKTGENAPKPPTPSSKDQYLDFRVTTADGVTAEMRIPAGAAKPATTTGGGQQGGKPSAQQGGQSDDKVKDKKTKDPCAPCEEEEEASSAAMIHGVPARVYARAGRGNTYAESDPAPRMMELTPVRQIPQQPESLSGRRTMSPTVRASYQEALQSRPPIELPLPHDVGHGDLENRRADVPAVSGQQPRVNGQRSPIRAYEARQSEVQR